jgi:hypothetical protein
MKPQKDNHSRLSFFWVALGVNRKPWGSLKLSHGIAKVVIYLDGQKSLSIILVLS